MLSWRKKSPAPEFWLEGKSDLVWNIDFRTMLLYFAHKYCRYQNGSWAMTRYRISLQDVNRHWLNVHRNIALSIVNRESTYTLLIAFATFVNNCSSIASCSCICQRKFTRNLICGIFSCLRNCEMAALTYLDVSFWSRFRNCDSRVIFSFFFSFEEGYIGEERRNGQFPAVFMGR